MPSFFEGILLVLMIFGFSVGVAIIIKMGLLWMEQQKSEPTTKINQEPKIYLVKQTQTPQKPRTRKRRSPKIAFKGLVLKPENVMLSKDENQNTKNQSEKNITF